MKKSLLTKIVDEKGVDERGLRVTLSRIKKRENLRSIDQAACFYVLSHHLNVNVSSVIDDITRTAVQARLGRSDSFASKSAHSPRNRTTRAALPKVKWITKTYHTLAARIADFYPYLFFYENALRLKVNEVMQRVDPNWWESKIKNDLPDCYKYSNDRKADQANLPMIGRGRVLQPYEHITLGHLEQIIVKYSAQFVPAVFPNLQFFTGHMVIPKRVRHAVAHMSPATTPKDIRHAKNDIDILIQYFASI